MMSRYSRKAGSHALQTCVGTLTENYKKQAKFSRGRKTETIPCNRYLHKPENLELIKKVISAEGEFSSEITNPMNKRTSMR